uniref:Uncharacterized protein n=1 Tax=Ciona savignyi TaxID=51511 RepID=H2YHQ6_CIOSA
MEWSQWSSCSNTCGGQQTRLQRHTCGDDPNVERRPCGGSGVFGAWTGYTPCSQSCLGGTQTRRRFDVCTRDVETESQNCGVIGAWGGYSAWSQCTRTCGGGEQSRTRVHSCPANIPGTGVDGAHVARTATPSLICKFVSVETDAPSDGRTSHESVHQALECSTFNVRTTTFCSPAANNAVDGVP